MKTQAGETDVIRKATARDNVCIQPHDIDGDGRIDFALGAGWHPPDTKTPSTLQWLGRDAAGHWQVHPIHFEEPTLHRLRRGDVKGSGKKQLVVAALQGRGTRGPNWGAGTGFALSSTTFQPNPAWKTGQLKSPILPYTPSTTFNFWTPTVTIVTKSWPRVGKACSCSIA